MTEVVLSLAFGKFSGKGNPENVFVFQEAGTLKNFPTPKIKKLSSSELESFRSLKIKNLLHFFL